MHATVDVAVLRLSPVTFDPAAVFEVSPATFEVSPATFEVSLAGFDVSPAVFEAPLEQPATDALHTHPQTSPQEVDLIDS
jgi:hypothetical protein